MEGGAGLRVRGAGLRRGGLRGNGAVMARRWNYGAGLGGWFEREVGTGGWAGLDGSDGGQRSVGAEQAEIMFLCNK